LEEYRTTLLEERLDFCIFGHIGNGHVHVNILPKNRDEMDRGWELYTRFARSARQKGGSICAEHGIGRLKRKLLPIQFTKTEIENMKKVKRIVDPENRLNPDVLFPEESAIIKKGVSK
jgi:D-lactate dehydrogenase (cytochrome)